MSELRDLSKLPTDQAYWDRLEARITAELGPAVQTLSPSRTLDWWAPLSARAWALGGLAAAAGLAAILLLPARSPSPAPSTAGLFTLPGSDPATLALVSANEPPALASLLFSPAGSR